MAGNRNVEFPRMSADLVFNQTQSSAGPFVPQGMQYPMMHPRVVATNPMFGPQVYPLQTFVTQPLNIRPNVAPPPYTPQMAHNFQNKQRHFGHNNSQMRRADQEKYEKKGRHFHEQQMRLKQLTKVGVATADADKMIESMFGKMNKPKIATNTGFSAVDSDSDSFGDFMQGPSASTPQPDSKPEEDPLSDVSAVPGITAAENGAAYAPNQNKKDLMAMMIECSDLSASQKARTFQKPSLRQVQTTHPRKPNTFIPSQHSRRWTLEDNFSGLFRNEEELSPSGTGSQSQHHVQQLQHKFKPPPWCFNDDQIPQVYKQVLEATSGDEGIETDRLYPILLLSGLPRTILRQMWEMVNQTAPGKLIKSELYLLLSLIAVAQNNQGVPSLEILSMCPQAPVPFLNQPQQISLTTGRYSFPQDMLASGAIPGNSATSAIPSGLVSGSAPAAQFNIAQSATDITGFQAAAVQPPSPGLASEEGLDDDDDFAEFQEAPKAEEVIATIPPTSNNSDLSLADNKIRYDNFVPKSADQPLPELSPVDKYSNVRNFFCSDDSSAVAHQSTHKTSKASTNSFDDDDDYEDFRSADSKPSDDTSHFSTSEQSEGEDFKILDSYIDDFSNHKKSFDIESPLHKPLSKSRSVNVSLSASLRAEHQASAIPVLMKPLGVGNIPPVSAENAGRRDYSGFKPATVNKPEDDFTEFQGAPKVLPNKSGLLITEENDSGEDKYAALRAVNETSLFSATARKDDREPLSVEESCDDATAKDEGWAEFQSSVPVMLAVDELSERAGWADFQSSVTDRSQQLSDSAAAQHSDRTLEAASVEDEWADFQSSTDASFSKKPSSVKTENTTTSGVLTIRKENLQKGEIMDMFKVREDILKVPDSLFSNESFGDSDEYFNKERPERKDVCSTFKVQNSREKQSPQRIDAHDNTDGLSPEIDISRVPPPLNDHEDDDDEFGGFSRGIEDFDVLEKPNIPSLVSATASGLGLVSRSHALHLNRTLPDSRDKELQSCGSFEFGDEDSHSSKDTDSWQEQPKFQKEDSQSISSLELSYPSGVRQTQRDCDVAADSHSVSSLEFSTFESSQKQDTAVESKSLDSLEFRNEDANVNGNHSDDNAENIVQEANKLNKNTTVQVTSETPMSHPVGMQYQQEILPGVVDRYSSVIQEVQGSDRHLYEWGRCLQKCYEVLKDANNMFNSISSSSVCNEVIKSSQGSEYLVAVIEIYQVVCKITVSMRMSVLTNEKLEKLLKIIDLAWNNLTAFISSSSMMSDTSSFSYTAAVLKSNDTASQLKACGICLLNVDHRNKGLNQNEKVSKLTYSGRQYHASCANFWVNCVDSMLPALKLPELI